MFAARRLITQQSLRIAARHVQTTPRRFASASSTPPDLPDMNRMMNDPQVRETFEKLSRHPPAILAMQKIGELIQKKGFEPGKPPSKMDMLKLMMDKEFREAAQDLGTEMQKAGVELNSDVFTKLMNPESK